MVKSLSGLRGIFALMIFAHHYPCGDNGEGLFGAGGDCGVAFFFILSGFVLTLGARGGVPPYRPFLRRRLAHIYPLHLICLLLWLLLHQGAHLGRWLMANVALLQSWVPLEGIYFSGNAVGWCLSDFLFFYLLFPALQRLRLSRPRLFVTGAASFIALTLLCRPFIPPSLTDALLYINPLMRLADFLLGILLFMALERMRPVSITASEASLIEAGSAAILIAAILLYSIVPSEWGVGPFWWAPVGIMIAAFYFTRSAEGGLLTRLLATPPMQWLGAISYPYYMTHNLTLRFLSLAGIHSSLIISLAATLLAGWIMALLLRPLDRKIKN